MKRLHVHIKVADLEKSIGFYATLFGTQPSVHKPDYAKWSLAEPAVNFAISQRAGLPGIEHLGIEVDSDAALAEITDRLKQAENSLHEEHATTCCYARSNKTWAEDPQGVKWETFHSFGSSARYGADARAAADAASNETACCTPAEREAKTCCDQPADGSACCAA